LGHIEGVGRAKLGRYGTAIVAIVLLPIMRSLDEAGRMVDGW